MAPLRKWKIASRKDKIHIVTVFRLSYLPLHSKVPDTGLSSAILVFLYRVRIVEQSYSRLHTANDSTWPVKVVKFFQRN